jgi:hypothetical protein
MLPIFSEEKITLRGTVETRKLKKNSILGLTHFSCVRNT